MKQCRESTVVLCLQIFGDYFIERLNILRNNKVPDQSKGLYKFLFVLIVLCNSADKMNVAKA